MGKAPKDKKRKRPWYTASEPLTLSGTVEHSEAVGEAGRFAFLTALVRWIPAHRAHRGGRDKAQLAKVLLVAGGLGIAAWFGTIPGIVLGGCVIASALVLPVPQYRKSLWIARIEALGGGRTRSRSKVAEIHWNGRKVSVRVDGKVVRSLRPFEVGSPPLVGLHEDAPILGLIPRSAGVGAPIWVRGEGALPAGATIQGSFDEISIDDPVQVRAGEWKQLWETMTDPRHAEDAP
jgi:hypothetical protein